MNSDSNSTNILVDVDLEIQPNSTTVSQNEDTVRTLRLSQQQSCDSINSDGKFPIFYYNKDFSPVLYRDQHEIVRD